LILVLCRFFKFSLKAASRRSDASCLIRSFIFAP
jgi:hypothetical protein